MITVELFIKGDVQRVFYRATAGKKAEELSINGQIENRPDGSVKAIITGTEENINKFVAWCKEGTAKASVDQVIVSPSQLIEFEEFKIIRN